MDVVLVAGFGLTLYVAGVTLLASQETERVRVPVRRWIPAVVALAIAVSRVLVAESWNPVFAGVALCAIVWPLLLGSRLGVEPSPERMIPTVGALIRGLLLLQATFASLLFPAGTIVAGAVLLAWPINVYLARRFYLCRHTGIEGIKILFQKLICFL